MAKRKPLSASVQKTLRTKAEKSRIRWLADRYANGNLSLWVIRSALEMPRKKIKETELDLSRRYKKKKY